MKNGNVHVFIGKNKVVAYMSTAQLWSQFMVYLTKYSPDVPFVLYGCDLVSINFTHSLRYLSDMGKSTLSDTGRGIA